MAGAQPTQNQNSGSLHPNLQKASDPLKLFKNKDKGGAGLPDPLGLYDSAPPGGDAPTPPTPPTTAAPTVADAQARLRAERQSADDQLRKKGRRTTIRTSDVGVGDTPVTRKTLVGS